MKNTGNFTKKVIIKDDYIKEDGTAALYIQVFLNKKRKRFPLNISVAPKNFDKKRQRVKASDSNSRDLNLLIEKQLGLFTDIATEYRLRKLTLTMDLLYKDVTDPDPKICFLKFYEKTLKNQLQSKQIKDSTFRQQKSTLVKLKEFKNEVFFSEINKDFLAALLKHLKVKKNNAPNTIATTMKNVKKYLHLANEQGIHTDLNFTQIKVKKEKGNREFLDENEIKLLYEYYSSKFIQKEHKLVLKKFLFSCFTGLRISDVQNLKRNNFLGEHLVFTASKTGEFQRFKINKTAMSFVNSEGAVFNDNFTDQTINVYLKEIAEICEIKKRITFHVSRHTFATQFLIKKGEIRVLQKILGHSKIETTMIYVHVVEEHINEQMDNLDGIINL